MKLSERVKIIYGQYGYACVNACFCKALDERREREREKKNFLKSELIFKISEIIVFPWNVTAVRNTLKQLSFRGLGS